MRPLMFDNVGKKLQQSINTLLKKTNVVGWSDNAKNSGVSSLYPVSKQNSRPTEQMQEVPEGRRNMMKQSHPDRKDIVYQDVRPTFQQTAPVSPNMSRQRISFNNAGSPPHQPITPTYSEPQYLKQGEPNGSHMRTPSWNSPAKNIPSSGDIKTPAWNSSSKLTSTYNSPPGRPPLVNAQSPRNSVPLVNAAPPLNGAPYAQPQRVMTLANQDSKPNYRPFESIGSKQVNFSPSKQNGKIIESSNRI